MPLRFRQLLLLFASSVLALSGCDRSPERRVETRFLLGTTVSVTTYGRVRDTVFESIFDRVLEIEQRMSTTEEDYADTELLRVNRAAGLEPVAVSADTLLVVERALEYSQQSGGAFDVTVGPLVSLWGIGSSNPTVPHEEALEAALSVVDYTAVEVGDETLYLPSQGMGIDVGGIAKGYAADEAARILKESGVESALLDFGGNILVVGEKPDETPWRIGIQVPDADAPRGTFLGIVQLTDRAVVTSGTYERYFEENGVRYHHILDTETGFPVENGLESVTIVTSESLRADALSTAVFAVGLEKGLELVESLEDIEAAFVTSDDVVYLSSGMGAYFTLTNDEFRPAE